MTSASSSHTNHLRVAIIGGSIAGCSAAIALQRAGCDVTIFERSGDELKDRGAGIGVPTTEIHNFIEQGFLDQDLPFFQTQAFLRIRRTNDESRFGYLAWRQPSQVAALNWSGLYRNLRTRVADANYRTQQLVVGINDHGDGEAVVRLADDTEHHFDLVVCADGYASLGRRLLFPEVNPEYAGYVLWRGSITERELSDSPPLEGDIRCVGYDGGHGIFYFVPGANGSIKPGERLVNWGIYVQVPQTELGEFLTDKFGSKHEGSLPPGSMPLTTEASLKNLAQKSLPEYYAEIAEQSQGTYAYAIFDCEVPAYRQGRICLVGDAGAFARPHTGAGAFKGMNDALSLGAALSGEAPIETALANWNSERTATNNGLVRFGNQLGRALVEEIPDWSQMDVTQMQAWYESVVTIASEYIKTSA